MLNHKKLHRLVLTPKLKSVALVVVLFTAVGVTQLLVSHAGTYAAFSEGEDGIRSGNAAVVTDTLASGGQDVLFGSSVINPSPATSPSSTAPCGMMSAPAKYKHVVWLWMENKDQSAVNGHAPYINDLGTKCSVATNVTDTATTPVLPSEPQYVAATSGSNCNIGITSLTTNGTGCIVDNDDGHTVTTTSIFALTKASGGTWKSYQESMPSNCALVSARPLFVYKHNPASFYANMRSDCALYDVPVPGIVCTSTSCATPSGSLADDIKNGTLPTFSFITPNMDNDMHDGTIQQGDSWAKTYLSLLFDGPNYKAGDTAVLLMWDEGSSNSSTVKTIPTVIAAPSIKPGTNVTTQTNNIGLLKTTQEMLGLTPLLGCASGTPPGGVGTCNPGSNVSIRTQVGL